MSSAFGHATANAELGSVASWAGDRALQSDG